DDVLTAIVYFVVGVPAIAFLLTFALLAGGLALLVVAAPFAWLYDETWGKRKARRQETAETDGPISGTDSAGERPLDCPASPPHPHGCRPFAGSSGLTDRPVGYWPLPPPSASSGCPSSGYWLSRQGHGLQRGHGSALWGTGSASWPSGVLAQQTAGPTRVRPG